MTTFQFVFASAILFSTLQARSEGQLGPAAGGALIGGGSVLILNSLVQKEETKAISQNSSNDHGAVQYKNNSTIYDPKSNLNSPYESVQEMAALRENGRRFSKRALGTKNLADLPSIQTFASDSLIEVATIENPDHYRARMIPILEEAVKKDAVKHSDDWDYILSKEGEEMEERLEKLKDHKIPADVPEKRVLLSKEKYTSYLQEELNMGRKITDVVEIKSSQIPQYKSNLATLEKIGALKIERSAMNVAGGFKKGLVVGTGAVVVGVVIESLSHSAQKNLDQVETTQRGTR